MRVFFSGISLEKYTPMLSSFTILVPFFVGAITVLWAERTTRKSWKYYFWAAAVANALFVLGTLLLSIEGIICCILAVPLFAFLGGIGGLMTGLMLRVTKLSRKSVYGFALAPLVLGGFEQSVPLPMTILSADESGPVAAPPGKIWMNLLSARSIQPEEMRDGFMYRIGVPLPLSAETEERDGKLIRHIAMDHNIHFDQVASVWQPERSVLWTYRFTKDSFPPRALDDHVRIGGEYFDVVDTEYVITETPKGSLLLTFPLYLMFLAGFIAAQVQSFRWMLNRATWSDFRLLVVRK